MCVCVCVCVCVPNMHPFRTSHRQVQSAQGDAQQARAAADRLAEELRLMQAYTLYTYTYIYIYI